MESQSRTHSILNGAAVALFAVLLIAAVTFSGVSDVALTHIFLILAFGVGVVIVLVEIVPNKSRKRKALLIGLLGLILLGFDRLLIYLKASNQGAAHSETATSLVLYLAALRGLHWRPLLVGIITGTLVTCASALAMLRRRRLIEDAKPRVQILTPVDGEEVGWHRIVRGSIYPSDSELQLLIQPSDGWWYVQSGPLVVRGHAWSFNCEFGEQGKAGHPYKVVAVHGTSLTDERYKPLPEKLVKSAVITLNRRLIEDFIDCPDQPLHQTRIDDKSAIREMVKVCMINCEFHIDAKGAEQKYIDFRFWFLNLSLFPVSIESMKGKITFRHETSADVMSLDEAHKLDNEAAIRRHFRKDGCFVVRQFLASHELEPIRSGSAKSVFYLKALHIFITGDGFDPVSLAIPDFIYKGERWKGDGDCDFLFANMAQAEAKVRELETANESLKSELDRLNREADVGMS